MCKKLKVFHLCEMAAYSVARKATAAFTAGEGIGREKEGEMGKEREKRREEDKEREAAAAFKTGGSRMLIVRPA